jgi:hypothetical protein
MRMTLFIKAMSLLLIIFLSTSGLKANSLRLDHERFVHLSEQDKEAIIVKTMEMIVEIESKYEYFVSINGQDEELKQRYTTIMQTLNGFLMSSAYASGPKKDWSDYAKNFTDQIENGNDKCFFAGWVSKMQLEVARRPADPDAQAPRRKRLCVHPSLINNPNAPERKAYEEATAPCRSGRNGRDPQISCNPAIFGFKSESDKSLFCVNSHASASNDAAYNCMQMALGIQPVENSDSKETRLKALKGHLEKNENAQYVNSIHNFMIKTCICEDTPSTKLNKSYIQRIRPHRTCYGMMKMIGETLSCENSDAKTYAGVDLTFFQKLKDHTHEKTYDPKSRDLEKHYEVYLNQSENRSHFNEVCSGIPEPVPPPAPEAKEKIYLCRPIFIEVCEQIKGEPESTTQLSCDAFIYETENEETNLYPTGKIVGPAGQGVEQNIKISDKEITATCTLPELPEPPAEEEKPKSTCSGIELIGEDKEVSATANLVLQDTDKAIEYNWTPEISEKIETAKFPFEKKDGIEVSLRITIQRDQQKYEITCSGEKAPVEAAEPTLTVTAGAETATMQTIKAKVEGNFEGWEIFWFAKGSGAPDRSRTPSGIEIAGDSNDEDPEEDEAPSSGKFSKREPAKSDSSVDQARAANDYELCAKLVKNEETKDGGCVVVSKLETKTPVQIDQKSPKRNPVPLAPMLPPRPPPQPGYRNPNDSLGFGIL